MGVIYTNCSPIPVQLLTRFKVSSWNTYLLLELAYSLLGAACGTLGKGTLMPMVLPLMQILKVFFNAVGVH